MLDIIGVGFGRTGTLSLKSALEQLGFGPGPRRGSSLRRSVTCCDEQWECSVAVGGDVFEGFLYLPGLVEADYSEGQVPEACEGVVGVSGVGGVVVLAPGGVACVVDFVFYSPVTADVGVEIGGGSAVGGGAGED